MPKGPDDAKKDRFRKDLAGYQSDDRFGRGTCYWQDELKEPRELR